MSACHVHARDLRRGLLAGLQQRDLHAAQRGVEQDAGAVAEVAPVPGLLLPGDPLAAEEVGQLLGGAALPQVADLDPHVIVGPHRAHLDVNLLEDHAGCGGGGGPGGGSLRGSPGGGSGSGGGSGGVPRAEV